MILILFVKDMKEDIAKHVTCNNYYYNNHCKSSVEPRIENA